MKKKTAYRIRNWREYNRALKQRGSLKVWGSQDALANWPTHDLTGAPGASPIYKAFETMATVPALYRMAGRQTQGFLQSLFALMKLALPVPEHSPLSRRRRNLKVTLPRLLVKELHFHKLVIDELEVKRLRVNEV